jgi:hypothetical protein
MSRNTRTGSVLERMLLPALEQGGYSYRVQEKLGKRFGIGSHIVDAVAEKNEKQILISVKWQQVSGTAEQKVPFEVLCLLEAIENGPYQKGYLASPRRRGVDVKELLYIGRPREIFSLRRSH